MSDKRESQERWRAVVGFEERYEVSDWGRVRNRKSLTILDGSIQKGYHRVLLTGASGRKTMRLHVLVLEAFVGPRPRGMVGCHNDGIKDNNTLSNLRWDTASANQRDAVKHRTHKESRKTHCIRGHLLESPNLGKSALAYGRLCLACNRAHAIVRMRGRGDLQQEADRYYAAIMADTHG